jgi:hypothetical protein
MVGKRAKHPRVDVARSKSDSWKQFREWFSFALSTLAFVISALGFYINSLKQTDDLRLFLKSRGEVSLKLLHLIGQPALRREVVTGGEVRPSSSGLETGNRRPNDAVC